MLKRIMSGMMVGVVGVVVMVVSHYQEEEKVIGKRIGEEIGV